MWKYFLNHAPSGKDTLVALSDNGNGSLRGGLGAFADAMVRKGIGIGIRIAEAKNNANTAAACDAVSIAKPK